MEEHVTAEDSQLVQGKRVCYLDQMVVSHLAKAQAGLIKDPAQAKRAINVYEKAIELVRADHVIFPTSEFHYIEGLQDDRLLSELRMVTTNLGFGTRLRSEVGVVAAQAKIAASSYLSGQPPDYTDPQLAFNLDPRLSAENLGHRLFGGKLSPYWDSPWQPSGYQADRYRAAKAGADLYLESWKKKYEASHPSRSAIINAEKKGFARGYFLEPFSLGLLLSGKGIAPASVFAEAKNLDELEGAAFGLERLGIAWSLYTEFASLIDSSQSISLAHLARFYDFLASDAIANIPHFDVYSNLIATGFTTNSYKPSSSDVFDFSIVACVFPYVDVFITDARLAELIRQSKLNNTHSAKVRAAGDQNIEALESLDSEIKTSI